MTGRPRSAAPKRTSLVKVLVTPELQERITAASAKESKAVSDWGRTLFELATSGIAKRAKNAKMTPLEWLQHCIHNNATPVDQTPAAQRRRTAEALGED